MKIKNKKNDNRMGWIRRFEKIDKEGCNEYNTEYEILSECRIPGILDYDNGKLLFGLQLDEQDKNGLFSYILKIKSARPGKYNENACKNGYYFKGDSLGELLSLFSLFFRCRFYLSHSFTGELTNKSLRLKNSYDFIHRRINEKVYPEIVNSNSKNLSGLNDYLDKIKKLPEDYHHNFILSCNHYLRALKEFGVDEEMIFIRLVSAIEALSQNVELSKKEDPLLGRDLDELVKNIGFLGEEKDIIKNSLENRKSQKKFIKFIQKYSLGYFKGGGHKAKNCKIKKDDSKKMLETIYGARSKYLHSGENMYLSMYFGNHKNWDLDPSMGMIIDNRCFNKKDQLPYPSWFEGLVRHCLINFLKEKISA